MPYYSYSALDGGGRAVSGTLRADGSAAFYEELRRKGLYCVRVRESDGRPLFGRTGEKPLPAGELAVLCRQLSAMAAAGVTINRSLEVLYSQSGNPRTKRVLLALFEHVQKGNPLSAAMAASDGAFSPYFISMIRSGESGGSLPLALSRLADHYEKEVSFRSKTMLALLYPIILGCVSLAVILVLFVVVLPSFITLFQSAASLPWYTRALLAFSAFLSNRWYLALGAVLAIAAGAALLMRNAGFHEWWDGFVLRVPFVGPLVVRLIASRFCRTFASLYVSGVPILQSLELSGEVLGNSRFSRALAEARAEICRGVSMASALQKQELFPQMMIAMYLVGEESGSLDSMLLKASEYYDAEADSAAQKMIGILQPIMIVVLGIIIGFVVMAVLAPIYSMYQGI